MKQLRHMQECMGTVRRFASDNGLGRLFYDRDYHVHLGGAISPLLVAQWIESGQLSIHDNIPDLVSASSSDHGFIKVWDALVKYRGIDEALFLTAYNTPNYSNLPTFLTMYRAYSKRHLLYEHAAAIARGEFMHSHADVRVSLPVPNEHSVDDESEMQYAYRAVEDMLHYYSSLLPTQRLFMTVPRQTFNMCKNYGYFNSFVNTLAEMSENAALFSNQEPAFDFAGQPLPLSQTIELLSKLRTTFPDAYICYHHGEVCPGIPFCNRVKDTLELLPFVDRIGHGLCLGLAVLNLHSEENGILRDGSVIDKATLDRNREIAFLCLNRMAQMNIDIEVSPSCNITLGGACNQQVLQNYVNI